MSISNGCASSDVCEVMKDMLQNISEDVLTDVLSSLTNEVDPIHGGPVSKFSMGLWIAFANNEPEHMLRCWENNPDYFNQQLKELRQSEITWYMIKVMGHLGRDKEGLQALAKTAPHASPAGAGGRSSVSALLGLGYTKINPAVNRRVGDAMATTAIKTFRSSTYRHGNDVVMSTESSQGDASTFTAPSSSNTIGSQTSHSSQNIGSSIGGSDLAQPPVDSTVRNQLNAAVEVILEHYNHPSRQAHMQHNRRYAETLPDPNRIENSGNAHDLNDAAARNTIVANINNGNHITRHQAYNTLQHVRKVATPLRNANQIIMNQIAHERAAYQRLIRLLHDMDNAANQTYNDIKDWNTELRSSLNFANQTMNDNPNQPAPANTNPLPP